MNSLSELEKSAALQILDYLFINKEAMRFQIEDSIKASSNTVGSSLRVLGELGLLDERREPPQKRYVSLSEKGREVAIHVNAIKNIVSTL